MTVGKNHFNSCLKHLIHLIQSRKNGPFSINTRPILLVQQAKTFLQDYFTPIFIDHKPQLLACTQDFPEGLFKQEVKIGGRKI